MEEEKKRPTNEKKNHQNERPMRGGTSGLTGAGLEPMARELENAEETWSLNLKSHNSPSGIKIGGEMRIGTKKKTEKTS